MTDTYGVKPDIKKHTEEIASIAKGLDKKQKERLDILLAEIDEFLSFECSDKSESLSNSELIQ